jgi:hypothetical protein
MKLKVFSSKKKTHSLTWAAVIIAAGFCVMLGLSLFAYKMESRYVRAMESKVASQQGRINELEKLLRQKEGGE